MEEVEDLVEGETGAGTFGCSRCSVRKAWAAVARVTWWRQPVQDHGSATEGAGRRLALGVDAVGGHFCADGQHIGKSRSSGAARRRAVVP